VIAIPFLPLLVQLATESGVFATELRGGLLIRNRNGNNNVLRDLLDTVTAEVGDHQENNGLVDDNYLLVTKQLKQMGLLKKIDIQMYGLLKILVSQSYRKAISIFSRMGSDRIAP
jgi:hypothetical protein